MLLASRAVEAGEELFISYGGLSPAALFAHYGIPLQTAGAGGEGAGAGGGSDGDGGVPGEAVWRAADGSVLRRRRVRLPTARAARAAPAAVAPPAVR